MVTDACAGSTPENHRNALDVMALYPPQITLATTAAVYLPANNQVLASYDGYVVIAAWTAVWLWSRSRRALHAGLPASGLPVAAGMDA